ncbi:unnamed protein product [Alopecurus aequalis]
MLWEWEDGGEEAARQSEEVPVDFDFISLLSKPKDYYKILEVDYDASEETIRSSFIRLALKWHPDKKQGEEKATSRFQDINEAYQVLSNPIKRQEYDKKGVLYVQDQNAAVSTPLPPLTHTRAHADLPEHKKLILMTLFFYYFRIT